MYQVVDFRIEPGLTLVKRQDAYTTNFFDSLRTGRDTYTTTNQVIELEVAESGGRTIPLARYLVGERITFRKSLTGLKLIRGLPDYSGKVDRTDLTGSLPGMVKDIQERYKRHIEGVKRSPFGSIAQSNLCQEIPMLSDVRSRSYRTVEMTMSPAEIEAMQESIATQMRQHQAMGLRDLYYTRGGTGTVTGRSTGRIQPVQERSRRWDMDLSELLHRDFEGDTLRYVSNDLRESEDRRFLAEMSRLHAESVPTRYVDNRGEITALAFAEAVQAAAEVAQGERARPPASRGPRPRNQRW